ncbi:unnamed protein product [Malus baccata var. baccata]
MAVAQQLPASLRAALTYSISLYNDPFFIGFSTTRTNSSPFASFLELLYGLRRMDVKIKAMRNDDA